MTKILHITSAVARTSVILLILLCLVHFLQETAVESVETYAARHAKSQTSQGPQKPDPAKRSIRFLLDGGVQQVHYTGEQDPNTDADIIEVYDANNVFVERRPDSENRNNTVLSFAQRHEPQHDKTRINRQFSLDSGFSRTLEVPVAEADKLIEIWRYNPGKQVFTGYDRNGNVLGVLGRDGLQTAASKAQALGELHSFEYDKQNGSRLLWRTDRRLYHINVETRSVTCLAESEKNANRFMFSQAWSATDRTDPRYADPNLYRPMIVLPSSDKTHLVLREPNQVITVSMPKAWKQVAVNQCLWSATRTDVWMKRTWIDFPKSPSHSDAFESQQAWHEEFRDTKKRHCTELYRVDASGGLIRLESLSWKETQVNRGLHVSTLPRWNIYRLARMLSPGAYASTPWLIGRQTLQIYYQSYGYGQKPFLLFLLMLSPLYFGDFLVPSLIFTAVVYWHGRSRWTSRLQMIPWLALTLCFNVAGLLTYLALNHTPLIRCASCHKKRGLAAGACARCRAPLPLPKHTRPHLLSLRSSC